MKFGFKLVLFTFLLFFSLNGVNAQGICCYDGDSSNTIRQSFADSCYEGEIQVGNFNERPLCDYDYLKKGCKIGGTCYATAFGKHIYDFPQVYDFFENKFGVDLKEDVCDSLVDFNSETCVGNYYNSNLINTTKQNNNNNYNDGVNLNPNDYTSENNTIKETQDMLFCSNVGEPFGFFATAKDCNSLTNDGKTFPCIYNPYLSGHLKVSSEQDNVLGVTALEGGCIAKSKIKACTDYKTKENCDVNPVGNDAEYSNSNLKSCRWVPVNSYFTNFEVDAGICISDAVSETKNYNFGFYSNRLNLLKNPSFEDELTAWETEGELSKNQLDAYDGVNTFILNPSQTLKQNVYHLDSDVSYRSLIHIKADENYLSTDLLTLKIIEHKSSGSNEESTYLINLNELGDKSGIFVNKYFKEHVVSAKTDYVEYILTTNKKVEIDALTFEIYDTDSLIVDTGIFKPIEIIDSRASNCELCFDKNQLNFCTSEKSSLMGDCSYMVEDLGSGYFSKVSNDKYLGKEENYFLNNWSSQSIVNSKLFCEMYIHNEISEDGYLEGACENPNNYVNSKFGILHPLKKDTLCKWNEVYGCYKDSDGSLGPDTIDNGGVYTHSFGKVVFEDVTALGFDSSFFGNYSYVKSGEYASDFAYGCDLVPPQSYIYFTAKDVNGTELLITDDFPNKILGDIKINLEVNDIETESCDYYNIPKNLLIDYVVNDDKSYFRFIPNSFAKESMQIKDLVIDANNNLLLEDGFNTIRLEIKDQSGNIGKVQSFTINGDFKGPDITALDDLTKVIGPNSTLDFKINDKTEITSCNFKLNPLAGVVYNNGIEENFYEKEGNFFNFSNKDGDVYGFKLPIYNTTENLNVYELSITCTDLFGQETQENYNLFTDYDTSFVMQDPLSFLSYDSQTGFLNDEKNVWAVSVEQNLNSCEFDFKQTDGTGSLEVSPVGQGFKVESFSNDVTFYSNITGNLNFKTTGVKNISIMCKDAIGNKIIENLVYYYDTIKPELIGIELESNSIQTKTVVNVNDTYYVRRLNKHSTALDTKLNVIINGTESWVSDKNLSLKYFNNGTYSGEMPDLVVGDLQLNESHFVGKVGITNFDNIQVYAGEKLGDLEFYAQKYELTFKDKAGNYNVEPFEFYFDDTTPNLIFGDSVFAYNYDLFTKEENPLFGITFNTPEYREFSCNIEIPHKSGIYKTNFGFTNYLKFKLSEIIPDFKMSTKDVLNINFDCVDKYDVHLTGKYNLNYDNMPPILDDVYFSRGNSIYLPNSGDSYVYGAIEDNLIFDFEDTNEKAYECTYKFTSSDYDCKNTTFKDIFSANENLKLSTGIINLLSENYNDSICYRNRDEFNHKLTRAREDGSRLETLIHVEAECQDKVKFKTDVKKFDYNVNYVTGSKFVDFDVKYDVDSVIFEVKSLDEFDKVKIAFDSDGSQEIMTLTSQGKTDNDVYIYRGKKSLSALGYPEENILIWAIGLWGTGEVADRITTEIVIDNQVPQATLRFPDADENNFIFSEEFEIKINAEDFGGSNLNKIDLYLDRQKIFSTTNQSKYLNGTIEIIEGKNYFSYDSSEYFGDLIFTNGQIGGEYKFTLKAYDGFGNVNETTQTIYVKDGVSIRIQDSLNAVVDFGGFAWITKNTAPTLSFTTSRYVDKCSIYPFKDEKWKEVLSKENLDQISSSKFGGKGEAEKNFSFDLTEFEDFNLNKVEDNTVEIGVMCVGLDDGQTYNFIRTLEYIDALPDYVLTSSEGFILNGGSYKTTIDVKSVGVNKYITCDYAIDGQTPIKLSDNVKTRFTKEISFNSKATGVSKLELECQDKLGTKGPKKTYQFVINKNLDVELSDLVLTYNNKKFKPSIDDKIFVSEFRNLGLEFKANRKDISCSVEIDKSSGSFFRNVIYFVENLFTGQNQVPVADEINYLYDVENGLEFSSTGVNKLKIVCIGGNNFEKEYDVEYKDESTIDFDLKLIS